ncbi:Transferase family [Phytophthora infestans]|uniref:Transferase family n=1 Tax=Phytophthora infestans TaxID=4787 RepID=A0A8S9UNY5_PHYIN|nr:Transferase family [Phytophthora infestans]
MATASDKTLLPLSPMDAVMHGFGFVILYIFPPSSSPYNLDKLQSSFISLVEQDYRILIGELYVDPSTGVVNVKQTAESLEKGAEGILFETNPENPKTTEQAIQERSLDLMPTTRGETELICVKGTLLNDGGLAIGINASHTLFDGEAMFTFMTVWGQHYSGVSKEQRLVVNHDRHLLKGKGKPSAMQHPEFRVVAESRANNEAQVPPATTHELFHFTPEMMSKIKQVASNGLKGDDAASSYHRIAVKRGEGSFSHDTRRVRESILQRTDEYLRDAIDFLTEQSDIAAVQVGTNFVFGHDLMFTSWLHMGMYNAEFDGIHPWFACAPQLPCYDGFVMVTEARKGGDGIDVGVFLECTAMEKLKKIFAEVTYL